MLAVGSAAIRDSGLEKSHFLLSGRLASLGIMGAPPLNPPDTIVLCDVRGVSGGTAWCRETPVSRTAMRLIGVVFSSLAGIGDREGGAVR